RVTVCGTREPIALRPARPLSTLVYPASRLASASPYFPQRWRPAGSSSPSIVPPASFGPRRPNVHRPHVVQTSALLAHPTPLGRGLCAVRKSVLALDDAGYYKIGVTGSAKHRHHVTALQ